MKYFMAGNVLVVDAPEGRTAATCRKAEESYSRCSARCAMFEMVGLADDGTGTVKLHCCGREITLSPAPAEAKGGSHA